MCLSQCLSDHLEIFNKKKHCELRKYARVKLVGEFLIITSKYLGSRRKIHFNMALSRVMQTYIF